MFGDKGGQFPSLLCPLKRSGCISNESMQSKQPSKMVLISLPTPFWAFRVIEREEKSIRETLR